MQWPLIDDEAIANANANGSKGRTTTYFDTRTR